MNFSNFRSAFFVVFLALSVSPAVADIQITNMNDINLGTWSGSGAITATDAVCVYENNGNDQYRVQASGSGAGFAFTLAGGDSGTGTIVYTVTWIDSRGVSTALAANVQSARLQDSSGTVNCGGGTNAVIRIDITNANLLAAESGSYAGTLTIVLDKN